LTVQPPSFLPPFAIHRLRPLTSFTNIAPASSLQNQEFFAEEANDDRYETESEPEDRFDADFSESVRGCF
jgi:hypothetical protein